jgi:deferrochelatase/peroxidase EfeB
MLANPRTPGSEAERILRRGYSFDDGLMPDGKIDAGLFFAAFQRDPRRQFVPIQRRLAAHDLLGEYLVHTGSALFAVPPGCRAGGYVGETLV